MKRQKHISRDPTSCKRYFTSRIPPRGSRASLSRQVASCEKKKSGFFWSGCIWLWDKRTHSPCTYLINRAAFKSAKIATAKSGAREGQHRCPQKIICEHQFGSSAVTEGRRNTSTNQISTSVTGEMCTPLPAARRNICPISLNTSRLCVPHIRTSLSGAAVPTRS